MYLKDPKKSTNITAIILILLIVILLGVGGYMFFNKKDQNSANESEVNNVNYDPPTEEEKSAGDDQKAKIVENESEEQELPDEAEVVIVDASQYEDEIEVRAFVANLIEDGECEITFTRGSETLTRTVPAYADASTTPCVTLDVARSEFPTPGTWDVSVVYKNSQKMGSAQGIIEVE